MALEITKLESTINLYKIDIKMEYLKDSKKEELSISGKFDDIIDNQGYEESWTCYAADKEMDAVYSHFEQIPIDWIFARIVLFNLFPNEEIIYSPQLSF